MYSISNHHVFLQTLSLICKGLIFLEKPQVLDLEIKKLICFLAKETLFQRSTQFTYFGVCFIKSLFYNPCFNLKYLSSHNELLNYPLQVWTLRPIISGNCGCATHNGWNLKGLESLESGQMERLSLWTPYAIIIWSHLTVS